MKLRMVASMGATAMMMACGGDGSGSVNTPTYDSLYTAPAGAHATANSIDGLWAATTGLDPKYDVRWQITASGTAMVANRCTWQDGTTVTAGITISMRVDATQITSLESKSDRVTGPNGLWCSISVSPKAYPYAISGYSLTITDPDTLVPTTLVKVSD